jgi:hypothetical protein
LIGGPAPRQNTGYRGVQCFVSVLGARSSQPGTTVASTAESMSVRMSPPGDSSRCHRCGRPDRVNGPARVCMPRLQRRRPDTTAVGDVLLRTGRTGEPLVVPHPYPVVEPLGWSGRDGVGAGLAGTRVPILSKSVGGDKPQYPVGKSTSFDAWARRGMLAMLAGDAA